MLTMIDPRRAAEQLDPPSRLVSACESEAKSARLKAMSAEVAFKLVWNKFE